VESESAFWVSRSAPTLPTVELVGIFKRRAPAEPVGPVERPQVRQYRYLLGTADLDALQGVHREALASLDVLIRAHILRTSQDRTLNGRELTVDDVAGLAELLCTAEVQAPGIIVGALTEAALERLAHRVTTHPDAEPLLAGYGGWDGADPEPRLPSHAHAARVVSQETSPVIVVAPQTASIGPRSLASP
jgi:hypothetical protein